MKTPTSDGIVSERMVTGIANLDTILHGGLPRGSVTVIGGPPGSGKTILSHQIGFHVASKECKVIYFQTLSEPTAKRLRYLKDFAYFDASKLEAMVSFIDLGETLRSQGINTVLEILLEHVKREKPSLVVLDSFKAFGDFVSSNEQFRKFSYELVVRLMAWECTVLLLGEFAENDFKQNPLFSVIDGLILCSQQFISSEPRRILQVVKMRGTNHSRDCHSFSINSDGIHIFAPKFTIQRDPKADLREDLSPRCQFGIPELDDSWEGGIPRGSSLLVAGVAGTGKSVALLEFLYQGARRFDEKGIYISFEATTECILASARGFGWDIEREIERGLIKIIYVPQPNILVEEDLAKIHEIVEHFQPARVSIDSLSVFLDKVETAEIAREKVFQLATIVQASHAVGLFATNISYGTDGISRFGVEETVVDGVIILSSTQQGLTRERYIEIFKLRNTAHVLGRQRMTISKRGITVIPSAAQPATESKSKRSAVKRKASRSEKEPNGIYTKKNKKKKG